MLKTALVLGAATAAVGFGYSLMAGGAGTTSDKISAAIWYGIFGAGGYVATKMLRLA